MDSDGNVWYRGHDGRFFNEVDHPPTLNGIDGPRREATAYDNQFPDDLNAGLAGPVRPQTTGNNATGQNLATNMRRVGFTQPPNSTAHHIVSSNHRNAAEARRLIGEIDPPFDVNEAANGVFLPTNSNNPDYTAPNHARVHSDRYYAEITRRLAAVSPDQRRAELREIAREMVMNVFVW